MATSIDESTVHSRELGSRLRECRERAGMSAVALAGRIGISAALTSRIESGKRGSSELTILRYLVGCGVADHHAMEILDLYHQAEHEYYLRPQHPALSDHLRTLTLHEATASTIYNFERVFVPGLLQTPEYVRALMEAGGMVPDDLIEFAVDLRLARQALLNQWQPPETSFFISEAALRGTVGGDEVMHDQLAGLVFAADRPNCSIRVLPSSAAGRVATSVSYRLMDFADHQSVVHVDAEAVSLFMDKPADLLLFRRILGRLDQFALSEAESRSLLADIANSYDRPKVDRDDSPSTGDGDQLA